MLFHMNYAKFMVNKNMHCIFTAEIVVAQIDSSSALASKQGHGIIESSTAISTHQYFERHTSTGITLTRTAQSGGFRS
jgi:hypothetical protein